ncbi:MAG TPA: hypothetical protein VIL35_13020 [Vicinamibacterales bacterium]
MNDEELIKAWTALDPTAAQRRRLEARVLNWLEAHDTPLITEWINLVRAAPLQTFALVAASAIAIVVTSPLVWLLRVIL